MLIYTSVMNIEKKLEQIKNSGAIVKPTEPPGLSSMSTTSQRLDKNFYSVCLHFQILN